MKNYLLFLRKMLTKKNIYLPKTENPKIQTEEKTDYIATISKVANTLGLELTMHNLKKLPSESGWSKANCFAIDDRNMIYLYAPNDGMPACPFEFYRDEKMVIDNQETYSEITNLDDIMLQLVRIFDKSLDNGIVIDPYYFMLRLDDEVKGKYSGQATLVITEKAIKNPKLNSNNFDEAVKYFINRFLDHFICWNFGVSVNRNETLKSELNALNEKVFAMGIREWAGAGFEVYGVDDEVYHGLQHYSFPQDKSLRDAYWEKQRILKKP